MLYQNKYRIETTRLKNYDYSSPGLYYITICTKNREHFFGEIKDGEMVLSETGIIAYKYWKEIPNHFPFVLLDEFIIMPNHLHGILEIKNVDTLQCNVSTLDKTNKKMENDIMSVISPKKGSISVVLRSYKSACTRIINEQKLCDLFGWQSRFYDHIIRDEDDLNRISEYIINNPLKWNEDDYNLGLTDEEIKIMRKENNVFPPFKTKPPQSKACEWK